MGSSRISRERVGQQAARHAEALAHTERILLDLLVRTIGKPYALQGWSDAIVRLRATYRGHDSQVLATGQLGMKARLLDNRTDPRQRLRALGRHRAPKHAHAAQRLPA